MGDNWGRGCPGFARASKRGGEIKMEQTGKKTTPE